MQYANSDVCGLRQTCKYKLSSLPTSTPSPPPKLEIFPGRGAFTPSNLKDAIIQNLEPLTPKDALSAYRRAVEPWFPIVSISRLRSQLPLTWDEAPLDFVLLYLSIILLTTAPRDGNGSSKFTCLYHHTKSGIASAEGFGINSFLVIQARILVTLFEVAHGFYPAAYISIGAAVRAADALAIHPGLDVSPSYSLDDQEKQEETASTWCGILILDR